MSHQSSSSRSARSKCFTNGEITGEPSTLTCPQSSASTCTLEDTAPPGLPVIETTYCILQ
ncbi:hypothetical protein JOB18_017633 [Solea senegalensis]|uniref:Uncharacterized protein n=1 Tax=Solea senegalensis TaxID=28829 RepID=A0AAV6SCN3_SOLSE|nr:hypothetical protein JOB18_017633 [Solea senegalensis]